MTTIRKHVAASLDETFVVGLGWNGTWQIHRRDLVDPDGAETHCGFGATRFVVARADLPEWDSVDTVCGWCWREPVDRDAFHQWVRDELGEADASCCVEVDPADIPAPVTA